MIQAVRPTTDAATRPRPRAPFAPLRLYAVTAGMYAVATAVWTLAGGAMPGGRWLAVHLFTLGVVTNVVPAFTRHFGTTLARQPEPWRWWPLAALNAGILTLTVGMLVGATAAVGIGGTVVTAVVTHNWWDLRTKRRNALGARFGWVIRMYERAHGAFIHGAILGILMGTGVLGGAWYGTARLAHLHVNVLGWAGLTLLATLVFFGPTVLRVRIEEGADARARLWLPLAATGLTVGVLALLASAVGGLGGTLLRLVGAAGLGLYAIAAILVCVPVLCVARRAQPSLSGALLQGACWWLPAALVADVVVVAAGWWRLLDAVGLAVLVGALGQGIVGAIGYLAPMFTSADPAGRTRIRHSVERGAAVRAGVLNAGVVLLVTTAAVGTSAGSAGSWAIRGGWIVVAVSLLVQLATALARRSSRAAPSASGA